jgi:hypothetical protein
VFRPDTAVTCGNRASHPSHDTPHRRAGAPRADASFRPTDGPPHVRPAAPERGGTTGRRSRSKHQRSAPEGELGPSGRCRGTVTATLVAPPPTPDHRAGQARLSASRRERRAEPTPSSSRIGRVSPSDSTSVRPPGRTTGPGGGSSDRGGGGSHDAGDMTDGMFDAPATATADDETRVDPTGGTEHSAAETATSTPVSAARCRPGSAGARCRPGTRAAAAAVTGGWPPTASPGGSGARRRPPGDVADRPSRGAPPSRTSGRCCVRGSSESESSALDALRAERRPVTAAAESRARERWRSDRTSGSRSRARSTHASSTTPPNSTRTQTSQAPTSSCRQPSSFPGHQAPRS